MISEAKRDVLAQVQPSSENAEKLRTRYGEKVNIRDFDGDAGFTSEMDALVAYLQVLGTMVDLTDFKPELVAAEETGEAK
jgi:cytochrome c oxidase cbb3-type subunit 2